MVSVAVLMAVYNGENYLKEQVTTILGQQNVSVTIFVSDDCSTDSSLTILQLLDDERIVLLPPLQPSGSAAMNFFRLIRDVDLAVFDFVAFADQDDIWLDFKLSSALERMSEEGADGYSSNVTAFWRKGKQRIIVKSQEEVKWDYLFSSAGPGCTYVLTKKLAVDLQKAIKSRWGILNDVELHDWLIYAYARSNGYKWFVDERSSMMYRQHGQNVFGANSGVGVFYKRWVKARGGWYSKQVLGVALFCQCKDLEPVRLLAHKNYWGKVRLAFMCTKLRRKLADALMLFLILFIPGFK